MTAVRLFDEAKLAEVADLMGEDLITLVTAFATSGDEQMGRMRDAGGIGDSALIAQAAHQLKGSAGNLGAVALHERCEALEVSARAADLEDAVETIELIGEIYDQTLATLHHMVGG